MSGSTTIIIAGVPEHFNYPWQIALNDQLFKKYNLDVKFQEVPEGTGALIEGLKAGKWHIALALTEGLVKDIANGSDLRLLGTYVQSPLCWAISAGANSALTSADELQGKKIGISRFTSGSHLMACVLAMQKGWKEEFEFVVNNNFKRLRESVNDGSSDAFMWETFMTKPYHDSGEIKRIGQIYTPWPCFMVAAQEQFAKDNSSAIQDIFRAIQQAIKTFYSDPEITDKLSAKFGLTKQDASAWLDTADIVASPEIESSGLEEAIKALQTLKLIPAENVTPKQLLFPGISFLGLKHDDVEEKFDG